VAHRENMGQNIVLDSPEEYLTRPVLIVDLLPAKRRVDQQTASITLQLQHHIPEGSLDPGSLGTDLDMARASATAKLSSTPSGA
jgi:hypothetical protein